MKTMMKKIAAWLITAMMLFQMLPAMAESMGSNLVASAPLTSNSDDIRAQLTLAMEHSGSCILKGDSITLSVPEGYPHVEWSTENENIAIVENGVVTGVGEGTVRITATDEDSGLEQRASLNITVVDPEAAVQDIADDPENAEKSTIVILINMDKIKTEYDGQEHTVGYTASCSAEGFDADRIKAKETVSRKDAGVGVAELKPEDFEYDDPDVIPVFVVSEGYIWITGKEVTVKADDKTKSAGQPDPEFTVQVSGLVDADVGKEAEIFSFEMQRDPGEEAGEYAIWAMGKENQGNYIISKFVDGKLSILDLPLNVNLTSSAVGIIRLGDEITLTATIEEDDGTTEYTYIWLVDKGSGWEEAASTDENTYSFIADRESIRWSWDVQIKTQ